MPSPTTTDDLLELVRKSDLISPSVLETFIRQATAAAPNATLREMARLLVAAGLLTRFQADQIVLGKYRGFHIGKYQVLEKIGSGGMGTVYLCEHQLVGRRVAVKVLPSSQAANPAALARFYREARAAGVLDHPNLVKAHDVDQDDTGLHFLVMDYVDGANLQDVVTRVGRLPVVRAADYARQAAVGLQHAHDAGLVHRDVKPANLILERNGNVRVLDLGLARFYHDHTDLLTLKYDEKNVLGTADYVSPEQALNGHEVDIRTDIYSLGATFYFLLAGQPPFAGGKAAQKLIWHQTRQPKPVRELVPEVPEGMAAVLERMLAKKPADRYQTPGEVAAALAPWTAGPVPLPAKEEMPRLCPALAPTAPGGVPRTPPRPHRTVGPRRARPTTVGMAAPGGEGSKPVLGPDLAPRSPSAADLATPHLFSPATPTEPCIGVDPPPAAPARRGLAGRAALAAAVVAGGVLIGLAVRWLVGG